jgi:hypothetical protein
MADDLHFENNININMVSNLAGIPGTLMHDIQIDQDINCRIAGRCTHGDFINRELRDLTCRETGIALGCSKTDSERVQKLDAVDQIENLIQIGLKAGDKIKLEHLAFFAPKAVATS